MAYCLTAAGPYRTGPSFGAMGSVWTIWRRIDSIGRSIPSWAVRYGHAVGVAALGELAHDDGLLLGREVDEAAVHPQADVRAELVLERGEGVAGRGDERQLRTGAPRVEPDVAEIPPRRPKGEPLGL